MCRCIELLTAYDANINHAAAGGQTPLYLACKNGNKECIKLLLEAGTDRSIKTRVSTHLGEFSLTSIPCLKTSCIGSNIIYLWFSNIDVYTGHVQTFFDVIIP